MREGGSPLPVVATPSRMADERMHPTLKNEATRPAASNVLQQQGRFDTFVHRYNHERPHQALAMKTPATLYTPQRARIGDSTS